MLSDNQIIRLILGFKVRHLRMKNEFSYQKLSEETGLSTSYLNDIEKGKRYPKPDKINLLAKALGVDYNYMVATNASKKLQPIIDLISSDFLKLFPLQEFGISMDKLLELFTQTPDRVNAFISTIFKIARNYQVGEREFYQEALRSYQDMHNNHFPDLEEAARVFKKEFSIAGTLPYTSSFLEEQLEELYDIKVDRKKLSNNKKLSGLRSYFNPEEKILYIQEELEEAQHNFLFARELGFQFLKLKDRPLETTIIKAKSFEVLLNNYKASHFAAALLMDPEEMANDLRNLARENTWSPNLIIRLLEKYNVTPEMLFQRYTNIIPHYFGLEDLFFIRLSSEKGFNNIKMSKDLHLSQLHTPYNNSLNEHFCNRWVSAKSIDEALEQKESGIIAAAQVSDFWDTDKSYLCLSLALVSKKNPNIGKSVTIGLLITEKLKSIFHFLSDPALQRNVVNTTCERCSVKDCKERAAEPVIIQEAQKAKEVLKELNNLREA